jgi:hypothetical protein
MIDLLAEPVEPRVSGALFGAVAAEQVVRRGGRDFLLMPNPASDSAPDLDVTDYMQALVAAGFVHPHSVRPIAGGYVIPDGTVWQLTDAGKVKASEYAVTALSDPGVLHLRKAWAAMSGALIRLGRFEAPTMAQLADIPPPHAAYLLGHDALHRQVVGLWRRHRQVQRMVETWQKTFADDGDTPQRRESYRVLAFLRGDDLAELVQDDVREKEPV